MNMTVPPSLRVTSGLLADRSRHELSGSDFARDRLALRNHQHLLRGDADLEQRIHVELLVQDAEDFEPQCALLLRSCLAQAERLAERADGVGISASDCDSLQANTFTSEQLLLLGGGGLCDDTDLQSSTLLFRRQLLLRLLVNRITSILDLRRHFDIVQIDAENIVAVGFEEVFELLFDCLHDARRISEQFFQSHLGRFRKSDLAHMRFDLLERLIEIEHSFTFATRLDLDCDGQLEHDRNLVACGSGDFDDVLLTLERERLRQRFEVRQLQARAGLDDFDEATIAQLGAEVPRRRLTNAAEECADNEDDENSHEAEADVETEIRCVVHV